MGATMARHDEILREVMDSSGGYVFKTVGDAFCVAFLRTLRLGGGARGATGARLRGMGEDRAVAGTDGAALDPPTRGTATTLARL